MMRFIYLTAFLSAFTLAAAKHISVKPGSSRGKVIVCTTSTASDLKESKFKIENTDLNLCTHLLCIDNIWDKSIDPWKSKEKLTEESFKRFTNLRSRNPSLKVSLAIKYSLADYVRNAASAERRQKFIKKATDFILDHKFNGMDLIWDFSDKSAVDKENILSLVKELKKSFEQHNLLLTCTFIAEDKKFIKMLDIAAMSEYLDFIHFMPKYNYVETWPGNYRVEDVLRIRGISNLEDSIDSLINSGVSPAKLIIGVQFMGLSFHSILDLSPKSATFRRAMGHNEVCQLLTTDKTTKWSKFYDDEFGVTVIKDESKSWRGILRSTDVILLESGRSIANKVKFALSRKLAGAMAFTIDLDDYRGTCGMDEDAFADFNLGGTVNIPNRHNTTQPLLKTLNFAFGVAAFEEPQGRQPNKDTATDRISDIEPIDDITSKVPDKYKPLIPLIRSANDAMVIGYDKLREKAGLYEQDKPFLNILFNIPQMIMLFAVTLGKLMLG